MSRSLAIPATRGNSRRTRILAVVLVAILAVYLLPKLLFGGGDDGSTELESLSAAPPATGAVPSVADAAEPTPARYRASGKDPFVPLIVAGAGGGEPGAVSSTGSSAVLPELLPALEVPSPDATEPQPVFVPPPAAPAPAPAPTEPSEPKSTAPPMPGPAPRVERQIELVEIYVDGNGLEAATVRVDERYYEVAVGQEFAESYRALALDVDDECGVFLYGARRFSLCEGETRTT